MFATSMNYKLETFVSQIPDQKAWAVNAMTISRKGMLNYIFPPFRLLHKIIEDGCKTILIAPAWPRQSWFPDLLLLSCTKPLHLPFRGDLLSQIKGKKLHQGLKKLHLHAWLLSRRLSDREAFLKKQPSASLEQLDIQQGQYDSKWSIFCSWCLSKQIDPLSITAQQLAEFFLYLLKTNVIHLLPLRVTGQLLQGQSISQAVLILVVMSFYRSCLKTVVLNVRNRRLVPAWDLGIVLKTLQLSSFEPLDIISFKFLTYKYCFLSALATGRRRSELHALSVSESCIHFAAEKSSVTLLTDPAFFIAKKCSVIIVIPALPNSGPKNVCPVRTLLKYLDTAFGVRSKDSNRLFVPIKQGQRHIIAKAISSWICSTVMLAYKSAGITLPKNQVKTHELRAIASSWSIFSSASLTEMFSAGL
jgi:hypothetical protein